MLAKRGKKYLVIAREDLSRWPKGRALASANLESIAKFIFKDIVYQYRIFKKLIVNKKPKNKGVIKAFIKLYKIKRVIVLAYYLKANKIVKRGYKLIIDILAKINKSKKEKRDQVRNLLIVILIKRSIIKVTIGCALFYLIYSREAILPIKIELPI